MLVLNRLPSSLFRTFIFLLYFAYHWIILLNYTIELYYIVILLNHIILKYTNNGTDSYDFKIFRKPSITNVQIKSSSNIASSVSVSVLWNLHRTLYGRRNSIFNRYIHREALKKKNIKTIFTTGPNLKSLLCRNKTKLLTNSYPEVYELKCTCNSAKFGETQKKILTRTIEHQQDSFKGKRDISGATKQFKMSVTI